MSPDGKLVAYSRMTPAETRLVVQQLAGGEPVTVAQWPGLVPAMPAWSADGARLAYTSPRGLEVIPALGGVTRLVAAQTADGRLGWAAWSPAGDEIVYSSADTLYIRDLGADRPRFLLRAEQSPLTGLVARREVDRVRLRQPAVSHLRQPGAQLDLGRAGSGWGAGPDHRRPPAAYQPGVAAGQPVSPLCVG